MEFGAYLTVFNVFDIKETPFSAQVTPTFFYLKPSHILVGIFVLSYFTWKSNKNKTYIFSYNEKMEIPTNRLIWGLSFSLSSF
jgi:hypothetical protein